MSQFYNQCRRYQGQMVTVRCRDGSSHHGRIVRVSPSHVYIQPTGGNRFGGYGMGFWGGYYGGYGYNPVAVPLAFVTGVVLGGLLFW
ncbi:MULTISPECIES: hypothetical protein [Bacillaceae]|uniref:Uncharacterized protein n=1 Tax=Sutcliffiella horikoshii TaxID=79883 RepID=A0A5D4SK78_9BACI|nr:MULTISPECIES: hypothetical protein [Bacillaceae]NLP52689.1 hypothetical protein [Bacillus sp. RO1]TYS63569.1 hypothetical protein FZC76_18940 [Sutcliffiella horikoshii]